MQTQQDFFRNIFWWASSWLHPSEIPCDTLVVLSGRDSVAAAPKVYTHLRAWQCSNGLVLTQPTDTSPSPLRRPSSPTRSASPSVPPSPSSIAATDTAVESVELHIRMQASWSHGWVLFHLHEQRVLMHKLLLMAKRHTDGLLSERHPQPGSPLSTHSPRKGLAVSPTPSTQAVFASAVAQDRPRRRNRQVRLSWERDDEDTASMTSSTDNTCHDDISPYAPAATTLAMRAY